MIMAERSGVRFKGFRLLADQWMSMVHGWHFIGTRQRCEHGAQWQPISSYPIPIRLRPELGVQNAHRVHNMRLASYALDRALLHPGQALSMARLVGEPSEGHGYRHGPILIHNGLGESLGGGLCQVSTGLFNAALCAGLEILEHHNHSVDLWGEQRAFPLGRDSAFVYARKDVKFRNPHPFPVCLHMAVSADDTQLMTEVRAPQPLTTTVNIQTRIIAMLEPPRDAPASAWNPGWLVETMRGIQDGNSKHVDYHVVSHYKPCRKPQGAHA